MMFSRFNRSTSNSAFLRTVILKQITNNSDSSFRILTGIIDISSQRVSPFLSVVFSSPCQPLRCLSPIIWSISSCSFSIVVMALAKLLSVSKEGLYCSSFENFSPMWMIFPCGLIRQYSKVFSIA